MIILKKICLFLWQLKDTFLHKLNTSKNIFSAYVAVNYSLKLYFAEINMKYQQKYNKQPVKILSVQIKYFTKYLEQLRVYDNHP